MKAVRVAGDDLAAQLEHQAGAFSVAQARVWAGQLLDTLEYRHTFQALRIS